MSGDKDELKDDLKAERLELYEKGNATKANRVAKVEFKPGGSGAAAAGSSFALLLNIENVVENTSD